MRSPEGPIIDRILSGEVVTIGNEEWFDENGSTPNEETVTAGEGDIVQDDPDAIGKEGI